MLECLDWVCLRRCAAVGRARVAGAHRSVAFSAQRDAAFAALPIIARATPFMARTQIQDPHLTRIKCVWRFSQRVSDNCGSNG